jgi:hypothetical protein
MAYAAVKCRVVRGLHRLITELRNDRGGTRPPGASPPVEEGTSNSPQKLDTPRNFQKALTPSNALPMMVEPHVYP